MKRTEVKVHTTVVNRWNNICEANLMKSSSAEAHSVDLITKFDIDETTRFNYCEIKINIFH